ncbi:phosphotransferase [Mycoplasma sp. 'Moose RK']|uniref:phosphotransferase n=1 Tax=Mycoplasma sp. 'Moose RK' TaxID=2780095 RepID=UPI0018C29415|nr:phosphotransferase [Mycoplasma sp. 'Moose RK']MBG0731079.1 phosphotransferase [Mycoplasma sp. 'Moose RK']
MDFTIFPDWISKKLTKISLISCGFHNCSYQGFFGNEKVQVRLVKNDFVDWENEYNFIKNRPEFIYYKQGNFVKKWLGQQVLTPETLLEHREQLFVAVTKFQQQKITDIRQFDWKIKEIFDEKYHFLVKKYQFDPQVICHNDLQFKNILVDFNSVLLIDFEWVRLNNPYFDYVSLHLNLGIEAKVIIEYFGLDLEKFNDFTYLINVFTNFWNQKYYQK